MLGHLLRAHVTAADESDNEGGIRLLRGLKTVFTRLEHLWTDQGYKQRFSEFVTDHLGWRVEVVKKPAEQQGFAVLPKRWVVERSIAWYTRPRRLSRDYEYWETNSAAYLYLASIDLLLRRLAPAEANS
jgi:putative transposase